MSLVERPPSLDVYSLPYAVSTAWRSLPPTIPLSVRKASVNPTRTSTTRPLSFSTATANGLSGQSYSVYFPDSLSSLSYRLPSDAITSLTVVPIRRPPADCPAIMLLPVCAAAGQPSSATPTSATASMRITALTPSGRPRPFVATLTIHNAQDIGRLSLDPFRGGVRIECAIIALRARP